MSHSFKEMLLKFNTKRRPAFLECTFLQILLERKIWVGVVYFSAFVCLNVMTLIFFPLSLLLFFFFSEAQAQPIGKPLMSSKKQLT